MYVAKTFTFMLYEVLKNTFGCGSSGFQVRIQVNSESTQTDGVVAFEGRLVLFCCLKYSCIPKNFRLYLNYN